MKRLIIALAAGAALMSAPIAQSAQAQKTFASPEEAASALVASVRAADRATTMAILGQDAQRWIWSGDAVADRTARAAFLDGYQARNAFDKSGDRATLLIGADGYPFAFPIVKAGDRWRFDTNAGREELLARRIGDNELHAIEVLRAVVDAQHEYASEDRNGNGTLEYTQRFASSQGKRDGLYWPTKPGEPPSPLGMLVASAADDGYVKQKQPQPLYGYHFRPLRGQGSGLDYTVRGRTIGGFAVVAWPARYGNSGVMTFIVNHDGVVYEKDLGPKTQATASAMRRFDPDKSWTRVPTR